MTYAATSQTNYMAIDRRRRTTRSTSDAADAEFDNGIEDSWRQAAYDAMDRIFRNHPDFVVKLPAKRLCLPPPRRIIVPNYHLKDIHA